MDYVEEISTELEKEKKEKKQINNMLLLGPTEF